MGTKNGCYEDIKSLLDGMFLIQKGTERILHRELSTVTSKKQVNLLKKWTKETHFTLLNLRNKNKSVKARNSKSISNKKYYKQHKRLKHDDKPSEIKNSGLGAIMASLF
jgi:hypothetical protein